MSHNDVGDELLITHEVRDSDGDLVNATTVVLTVTLPNLTTAQPAVANPPEVTGVYEVAYTLATAGRYVFSWVTTNPNTAGANAVQAVAPGALPTRDDVIAYLGTDVVAQWSSDTLDDALAAEKAAQARVCRVGAEYPVDLRQALLRRVQVNLAKRALPLAVLQGDAEGGNLILPGRDPEVRRLEGPHRKVTVG